MNKYSVIVIGAGYAALGIVASSNSCLVIEESEMLGSDYHLSFRPVNSFAPPKTNAGKKLFNFLLANGIINAEKIDMLRMSTALCKYAVENCWTDKLLIDAHLVGYTLYNGVYEVTYYTNTGLHTAVSTNLIDTTAICKSSMRCVDIEKKYLNVICADMPKNFEKVLLNQGQNILVTSGFLPNEYTVSFGFGSDVTLTEARAGVEACWKSAFPNGEALIDSMGFDFDIIAVKKEKDTPLWLLPHNFKDPFWAFEAGCGLAENKGW